MQRTRRVLGSMFVVAVSTTATIFACGGDDGGGGGGGGQQDAAVQVDAAPDAPMSNGIGLPCTPPQQGSGQGDCPAGFTCLTLMGSTGSWCSKTCTQGSGDQCNVGYTGPGVAACILGVTFGSGSNPVPFCGVVCADNTGTCGAQCSGTCPGTLSCSAPLMQGSNNVGSACI